MLLIDDFIFKLEYSASALHNILHFTKICIFWFIAYYPQRRGHHHQ